MEEAPAAKTARGRMASHVNTLKILLISPSFEYLFIDNEIIRPPSPQFHYSIKETFCLSFSGCGASARSVIIPENTHLTNHLVNMHNKGV
jgi:hypothetical protein